MSRRPLMRALVIPSVGAPWTLRDVELPRPGGGEVLVEVKASGVCHNDVFVARGRFPFPSLDPVILGHEPAGEVVEVGPGVTSRRVGDRVGATWVQDGCGRCDYCRRNLPVTGQTAMSCEAPRMTGLTVQGSHAQYVVVKAQSTVLLPDGLSYAMAAPIMCAGYTAWGALRSAEPRPGERVAVLGVGGIGHLAIQYSRACGLETVAVTRGADKHAESRRLGADHVVADGEELRAIGGADVVLATGTSLAAAAATLPALRIGGRLVLTTIDPEGTFTIGPGSAIWARRQRILGATHHGLDVLTEALSFAARGVVEPVVEQFAPDEATTAIDRLVAGDVRFRAVFGF